MSKKIKPLELEHLSGFFPTDEQCQEFREWLDGVLRYGIESVRNKALNCHAFALVDKEGTVFAICGNYRYATGNDSFWSYVSKSAEPHHWNSLMRACNGVMNWLFSHGSKRIEVSIKEGYENAERAIKMLGFEKEGLMRNYGPQGENYFLYSKVK